MKKMNHLNLITLTLPRDIAKSLLFYLLRSYLWHQDEVTNLVAQEALCGNKLAEKAMNARKIVMEDIWHNLNPAVMKPPYFDERGEVHYK